MGYIFSEVYLLGAKFLSPVVNYNHSMRTPDCILVIIMAAQFGVSFCMMPVNSFSLFNL
jgi:hypothetical protein